MGPQGPIWGGIAPKRRHMGPLGPPIGWICLQALQGNCSVPRRGVFFLPENDFFGVFDPKKGQKKVEIEGVRPIWRDPQRNYASNALLDVQNGGMATHLVKKMSDIGSDWDPGLASTP